jgi:dihydroorotase
LKIIEGIVATSSSLKREQIEFDENTGLITRRGAPWSLSPDFIYSDDCLVFAGMGDVHIHAREDVTGKNNYKEDFASAREALHNGGLCHAGDMPNNPEPPIDDASYKKKFLLAVEKAEGELWTYAGIGPETFPLSFPVPYKAYMGPSIGELFFRDYSSLENAISRYAGQVVSFHCEDPDILESQKEGKYHHERRPVSAEVVATRDALNLIEKYNLQGKLCHFSSGEGLHVVREARARGVRVDLEVTPQHLYFDLEQLKSQDLTPFQMNPPIRFSADRSEMLKALLNDEIKYLATDHAPHSPEEKQRGISGLTGLDTYGPFVTWLLTQGATPSLIAKVSCENPGFFYNQFLPGWKLLSKTFDQFGKGVGFLEPGYRANFTVLNLKKPMMVTKGMLKTKAQSSPFEGIEFPGSVEDLFIGGKKL